ncbi:MAG: MFS transporter [Pseudomonadota bacterium]|nr:MFS transporter [Pseudomonadota bacterium]
MFLATLDSTIVAPALPTIGGKLGGAFFLPWIVSGYFLTSTAVTPLYGKLSDIHGRRPVMLTALALFLLGSVGCALSPDMTTLILARAVQGIGGGGLVALAQTVLADIASPLERAKYTVYISTMWAASSIAGPALGGFLAQHLSWTAIFWLNLPLGLPAYVMCDRLLRDLPQVRRPHRLDWLGGALVIGATAALMLALTLGGAYLPWRSPIVLGLGGAAAALAVGFVAHLGRAPEPLIPPTIFANRVVGKASASMFLAMLVYVAAVIYLPLYFQACLRLDPTLSGASLIVVLGASVLSSNFTGLSIPKMRRYKAMGYSGMPVSILALVALALFAPRLNFWAAEALILLYGLGLGTLFPILQIAVQNAVDPRDMGAATATLTFVRSLGSALGVAIFGAVVFAFGLGAPGMVAEADPAAAATAFQFAFGLMALATAGALLFYAGMEERPLRGPAPAAPEPV